MQTDLTKLDPDLSAQLPTGATTVEKLYATAIDDRRTMFTEAIPLEQQKTAAVVKHADVTQKWVDEFVAQSKELLSGPNDLFVSCALRGVDVRKQSLTTTTARETVMKDVVNDGLWIGYNLYNRIAAEVGFPLKVIPSDL